MHPSPTLYKAETPPFLLKTWFFHVVETLPRLVCDRGQHHSMKTHAEQVQKHYYVQLPFALRFVEARRPRAAVVWLTLVL